MNQMLISDAWVIIKSESVWCSPTMYVPTGDGYMHRLLKVNK